MRKRFLLTIDSHLVSNEEVLADLKRVASVLPKGTRLTNRRYLASGGLFSTTLLVGRFGSWNESLKSAGIPVSQQSYIPDDVYFAEIERVWTALGRQPRRCDWRFVASKISSHAIAKRFGSWLAALEAFTKFKNARDENADASAMPRMKMFRNPRCTPRAPSIGLRYQIIKRDGFKCRQCGRSPSTEANVVLHVDHIIPWSAGGETHEGNLQTLCENCNRGKNIQMPETDNHKKPTA